MELKMWNTNRF